MAAHRRPCKEIIRTVGSSLKFHIPNSSQMDSLQKAGAIPRLELIFCLGGIYEASVLKGVLEDLFFHSCQAIPSAYFHLLKDSFHLGSLTIGNKFYVLQGRQRKWKLRLFFLGSGTLFSKGASKPILMCRWMCQDREPKTMVVVKTGTPLLVSLHPKTGYPHTTHTHNKNTENTQDMCFALRFPLKPNQERVHSTSTAP